METEKDEAQLIAWKFVLAWVFAALVSTAISYLGEQYLYDYQYLTVLLKASAIAITQALVLGNYFKNPWFWATLTFAAYIGTGFAIGFLQGELNTIYSGLSEVGTYIFLFGFELLIQTIIAAIQFIALRKEVAFASRWIIISIFSVLISLISQILVINLIFRFGSPEVFGSYLRLINLFTYSLVASLITGIGLSYLLQNKIILDEELIEELMD